MTEHQITATVRKINTKEDFLNLINALAADELGESYSPFTIQQLNYYCRTSYKPHKRYRKFYIPKKSGGKPREILSPCPTLKALLYFVNIIRRALYVPSPHAMGFIQGRCVRDNASLHVGKNYVFNTDLKDFFPSISQYRVWKNLQYKPFGFSQDIAKVIAGLCCVVDGPGKENKGYLPQGSPCSPILTNIVCQKLDKKLANLARKHNLTYSRYADDITFSSMHNVYHEDSEFMTEFVKIIEEERFVINEKKTRLQKKGERQEVTGLVVNSKVNTTREYVRDIQSILYIWERYGFDIAYSKFLNKYLHSKAYHRTTTPDLCNVLEGKLLYLKMIVGEGSSVYQKLARKFDALYPKEQQDKSNIIFSSVYKCADFLSTFDTSIEVVSEDRNNRKQFIASCHIEGVETRIWISKKVAIQLEKILSDSGDIQSAIKYTFICLAKQGNSTFWLMMPCAPHKRKQQAKEQTDCPENNGEPINLGVIESHEVMEELSELASIVDSLEDVDIDSELVDYLSAIEEDEIDEQMLRMVKHLEIVETSYTDTSATDMENMSGNKSNLSADEILDQLVKSNFADLNILSQWDKIKKS